MKQLNVYKLQNILYFLIIIEVVDKYHDNLQKAWGRQEKIQVEVCEFLKGGSHPSPSYVSGIMYMVGYYSGNIQEAQQGAFHREMLRVCQHFRESDDVVVKKCKL